MFPKDGCEGGKSLYCPFPQCSRGFGETYLTNYTACSHESALMNLLHTLHLDDVNIDTNWVLMRGFPFRSVPTATDKTDVIEFRFVLSNLQSEQFQTLEMMS